MKKPLKNVAKSVHDRLLTLAKKDDRAFTEVAQLFAMERFLYRLVEAKHADKFVLKGGLMLRVWNAPGARPTRDTDLLGRTENTLENLDTIMRETCSTSVEPDGLEFNPTSVETSRIKKAANSGIRVRFAARLDTTRIPMQVDVGFGDVVVPPPVEIEVPPLLDFPAPMLKGYPRETTIAEKFQAMVMLGTQNTRMKDFYDLWMLSQNFDFDGKQLGAAIRATFEARGTALELDPIALQLEFAESAAAQKTWSNFLKKSGLTDAPVGFVAVIDVIRDFVLPIVVGEKVHRWSQVGGTRRRWLSETHG